MAEKRKKAMNFSSFGLDTPTPVKKLPKKEPDPPPMFESDPQEMRSTLQEVAEANRNDLNHLAKQYEIEGIMQLNMDELRELIYQKIRSGVIKKLTAFESRNYIEWKYRCNCEEAKKALGKTYNVTIKLKEGRNPPTKNCPYCKEPMECK